MNLGGEHEDTDERAAREQADKVVRLVHELNDAIRLLAGANPHWQVKIFDVSGDPPQIKASVWRAL